MNKPSRRSRTSRSWIPGLIVLAVGVAFLLDRLGILPTFALPARWWALFIVLGALPSLERAWRCYRQSGRVDAPVADALLIALAVLTVAVILLFDLAWHTWWPLFLVYAGVSMLIRTSFDRDGRPPRD